jgi:hypothetical protein
MGLHPAQQERAKAAGYRLGFGDGLIIGHERPDLPVDEIGYDADAVRNVLLRQYAHDHYSSSFTPTAIRLPNQIELSGDTRAEFKEQFLEYVKFKFLTGYDDGFQDGVLAAAEGVAVGTPTDRWRRPEIVDRVKELAIEFAKHYLGFDPMDTRERLPTKAKNSFRLRSRLRVSVSPHIRKRRGHMAEPKSFILAYDVRLPVPESMLPHPGEEMDRLSKIAQGRGSREARDAATNELDRLYDMNEIFMDRIMRDFVKYLQKNGVNVMSSRTMSSSVRATFDA